MEVFALMAAAASAGIAAALAPGSSGAWRCIRPLAGRALPPRGLAALVRLGSTPVAQAASLLPGWGWAARRARAFAARAGVTLGEDQAQALLLLAVAACGMFSALLFWSIVAGVAAMLGVALALGVWEARARSVRSRELAQGDARRLQDASAGVSGQPLRRRSSTGQTEPFDTSLRLGLGTEEALGLLAAELEAPGVELLATALVVSHRTGSPLRELLTRSARLVERQGEFQRLLAVKTAQVRLSVRIVCALPLALVLLLALISPDFQRGLLTPAGLASVLIALAMDAAALLIIRKLMRGVA